MLCDNVIFLSLFIRFAQTVFHQCITSNIVFISYLIKWSLQYIHINRFTQNLTNFQIKVLQLCKVCFAQKFCFYNVGIMLCSKLCWHNWLKPTPCYYILDKEPSSWSWDMPNLYTVWRKILTGENCDEWAYGKFWRKNNWRIP